MANLLKSQILERVEERLKMLGITERAVSLRAANNPDVIRNWRSKNVLPRMDTLIQVAAALGTTPEWLAFGAGDESVRRVPKISWVSAGAFQVADSVTQFDEFPKIEVPGLPDGDWFILQVEGDSMDRISPPESLIVVNRKDKRLVPNACYIIQDGNGGATYKRYRQGPVRFEPVSTNPIHEAIFPDNDNMPIIFGRVRRTMLEL